MSLYGINAGEYPGTYTALQNIQVLLHGCMSDCLHILLPMHSLRALYRLGHRLELDPAARSTGHATPTPTPREHSLECLLRSDIITHHEVVFLTASVAFRSAPDRITTQHSGNALCSKSTE